MANTATARIDRLQGAGIYYGAAMTEAISRKDETVYVIGGANSAGQAAMHFSRYAREVIMLVRGESLSQTMSQYLIDQIGQSPNIRVETRTQVVEVHGQERLEAISIACGRSGTVDRVPATSLFIFIGAEPRTDWLEGVIERDGRGFVLTGTDLLTRGRPPKQWGLEREPFLLEASLPGVFAVGDVRHGSVKRVAPPLERRNCRSVCSSAPEHPLRRQQACYPLTTNPSKRPYEAFHSWPTWVKASSIGSWIMLKTPVRCR